MAVDIGTGTLTFYKNGVSQGVAVSTGIAGGTWYPMVALYGGTGRSVDGELRVLALHLRATVGFFGYGFYRIPAEHFDAPTTKNLLATKTVYTGGATVDSLKPAEAGAQVFTGKSLTLLTDRTGANISYTSGGTLDSLKPATVGADVTSANTAADTANVNGVAAATISQGAGRANAGINSSNQAVAIAPATVTNSMVNGAAAIAATKLAYTGGASVDSLKPAAVGADVTGANNAAGLVASALTNAMVSSAAAIAAAKLAFAGGSTVESLSSSTAAIAGQGSLIPSAGVATSPSYTSTTTSVTITVPAYTFTRSDAGRGQRRRCREGAPSPSLALVQRRHIISQFGIAFR